MAEGTPVQVTINTKELFDATKLQNDCDDLRIVRSSEGIHTELTRSFHKASGATNCSDSTATTITFPIQSELTSGGNSGEYYLYYNNPGASNPGFGDDGYNIGDAQATIVCPFNGTTTCVDGETPSTATGAIRYGKGSALKFSNGSTLSAGSGASLRIADNITIEAWINPYSYLGSNGGAYSRVLAKNARIYEMVMYGFSGGEGRIEATFRRSDSTYCQTSAPIGYKVDLNKWSHVAATYQGGNIKIFINGVLARTASCSNLPLDTSDQYVSIGSYPGGNWDFPGMIDEIRISNIIRYGANFTPQAVHFEPDSNTMLLYHFDENGSDPRNAGKAIDASGNGNHGTITGAKYVSGVVGIDTVSSPVKGQSYAGHEGIFIEEGTTNLITNPSFEHGTYNTNWGLNYFNYNSSADTFTAKMAKRNSAGPFAAGVMGASDMVAFSHGNSIAGEDFAQNSDDDQGTVVFWWTPEFSSDTRDSGKSYFLRFRSTSVFYYDWALDRFYLGELGTQQSLGDYDVMAGQTYLISLRWDKDNFVMNKNAVLSVNDTLVGEASTGYVNWEDDWGETNIEGADGLIEGLTIYRRPLFDGTYGIDVGNGDEIAQIYNSGAGKDPTLITGSWDVVFALPTNASTGELATGTGNAWSHPHSSNLLYTSTTNTGGFMMNGTYTADGWANEGTPSSVAALATNEKVFAGGYKVTSDSANEGIYYEKAVTAGNDWVVRGLGHSDGICVPKIILYDQSNGTEIGSLTGTTTSTRTSPNVFIFTGEASAGMTTLRVKLINTASSGTCYWHQVEVLPNLIDNPSMETGSGDPWIPTGWSSFANPQAGYMEQEDSVVHSGQYSVKHNTSSVNAGVQVSLSTNPNTNKFFTVGGHLYGVPSGNGYNNIAPHNYSVLQHNPSLDRITGTKSPKWNSVAGIYRKTASNATNWGFGLIEGGGIHPVYTDDVYSFLLNDVSLTATPANEANSAESTGLRVDGYDSLTQPITGLSADRGTIKFKFTPRHSFDIADKFGFANPNIIKLWYDANNQIYLYKTGNKLRIGGFFNGTEINADWTNPTLNAGTTYNFEITYSSGGNITLTVDGVQKATTTGVVNFANTPNIAYFGTDNFGSNQYDSTISSFVALTPTENTTSPYYKFGSKSVKLVNGSSQADEYTIAVDPDTTNALSLSAYVFDATSGNVGGTVTASIAKLVYNGSVVTPSSYTDMGGGWWRLAYQGAVADATRAYGVQVLAGKTIYVDAVQLEDVTGDSNEAHSTSFVDGSLGSGYSWVGEENNSKSIRENANLRYPTSSNISNSSGSISMWVKPAYSRSSGFWNYSNMYLDTALGNTNSAEGIMIAVENGNKMYCKHGSASYLLGYIQTAVWYHIVANWDGTSFSCYLNSVSKGSGAAGSAVTNNIIMIGEGDIWAASIRSGVTISDFRIYDSTLTAEQVANIYQTGLQTHSSGEGNDEKYSSSGEYESDILDLGNAGQWGASPNFLVNEELNGNSINYETRTSDDNLVWSDYSALTGDTPELSVVSPPKRYLQIKANLLSTEKNSTPVFSGAQINYIQDAVPPGINATETTLKQTISGDTILEGNYTNSQAPYFSWTPGSDDEEGSGLRGYCLYLGPDANGNPANDKGLLGSSPGSTANTTCPFVVTTASIDFTNTNLRGNTWLQSSTSLYYLIIRAVDNTGNVYSEEPEIFSFKFDNTPPTNPGGLFAPAGYQREFESFIISWPTEGGNAPKDLHSTVKGFQYKLGTTGTWYGGSHSGDQDCNDVLTTNTYALDTEHDILPSGETPFFLRTIDHACNISASAISAILKYNSVAPSAPRDLEVTPETNDQNVFSFSWNAPEIFSGNENNITYCYTVNTIPTAGTCIFTSSKSLNPDAFATQPGENTFYIVSRDEASNINYGDYASVKFWANTSAPGVPRHLDVADISIKSTKNWRLTVSWDEPEEKGAGVAKYFVYRSLTTGANCSVNFNQFTKVGETAGGSYVDINLQQKDHYYCVRACDSTNNCSATSSTASNFPDGKFTEPAEVISAPIVSNVSTRGAKIGWITERTADSKISYGLASDDYFKEEVGSSQQVMNHEITLTNLEPGTIYYFRAKWTDEDGNTGISDEYTFTTAPPPSVKDVTVSSVGISTAVISFTTTGSTSANLYYGGSTAFGSVKEMATSPLESRYTVLLEGLQDGTRYYFRIDSVDSEGYKYEGTVLDFATLPQPEITNVRIQQVKNAAQPTILVSWESNTAVTSVVSIFPENNPAGLREEVNLELISGEHQMIIRGLLPDTIYSLTVKGSDVIGNQASSTAQRLTTATDTRPPAIINLRVETGKGTVSDSAQLIVTWTTDEPTTTQVEYGEGTGESYGQRTQLDSNQTLNHTVVISGLTPGKVYHLRALVEDDAGNKTESLDYVAITPKAGNTAIELVINSLSKVFGFLR